MSRRTTKQRRAARNRKEWAERRMLFKYLLEIAASISHLGTPHYKLGPVLLLR